MNPIVIEETDGPEPAVLFARVAGRAGSFFLDSGLASAGLGAYSFIGFEPFLRLRAAGGWVDLVEDGVRSRAAGDGLTELRLLLQRFTRTDRSTLPFAGGAVGYLSYDYGAGWEIQSRHSRPESTAADLEFGFYDGILAFDHARRRWLLVANPVHRAKAPSILQRLRTALEGEVTADYVSAPLPAESSAPRPCQSREHYLASVARIKDYIRSGDVYQVNLAQRFEAPFTGDPYALYQRLRHFSPAPFAAFLSTEEGHVIGCSPERFLRLRSGKVETRPIKGTRPRGATGEEDRRLAQELVTSAKERAELLMIVDLERNDLGRVCLPGSIQVADLYRLEEHPTVFHLVAAVSGQLRPGLDVVDLLRATFPGGSITGAPKIRAMQIIDELEIGPRHLYTGAIGYLGFDGDCDLSIAIRTVVAEKGRASYQVGAGIVWDSDPVSEYEETLAKGRALHQALSGGL